MDFVDLIRVNDVNHGEQERRCLRSGRHFVHTYKILPKRASSFFALMRSITCLQLNKPCDRMDTSIFVMTWIPVFFFYPLAVLPVAKSCRHRRGKLVLMNQVLEHEGTPKSEREGEDQENKNEELIGLTLLT